MHHITNIEGFRAQFTATVEGEDIYSLFGWNGRLLFQGTLEECTRYATIYKAKVRDHEIKIMESRRGAI